MMADEENKTPDRPSFTAFIRKGKEVLGGKRTLTFVQPQLGGVEAGAGRGDTQDALPDQRPQDKTQLRRAQVRSAQIKHRQRKAEYVKELEDEISELRNKIAATQNEAQLLHRENQVLHAQVQQSCPTLSTDSSGASPSDVPLLGTDTGELSIEDVITMALSFDDILNSPCFYMTSSPSSSQLGSTTAYTMGTTPSEGPVSPHLPDLSPPQIQQAINFILALEHICRNHHHYNNPSSPSRSPSNHTLMASSLALRTAPESVFTAIRKTTLFGTPLMSFKPPAPDSDEAVSWQASGLTLQNLYGLACTLQSDDDMEIRPVQVWFELVGRFGANVVLGLIDELKLGLGSVVRCPHYGAVLDRMTFERVVEEVFGSY